MGQAREGLTPVRKPVGEDLGWTLLSLESSKPSCGRANQIFPRGEVNKEKAAQWTAACGLSNAEHLFWFSEGPGVHPRLAGLNWLLTGDLLCGHVTSVLCSSLTTATEGNKASRGNTVVSCQPDLRLSLNFSPIKFKFWPTLPASGTTSQPLSQ